MVSQNTKRQKRIRRHQRVRAKIYGTKEAPRLSVFKSNRHIFAQVVDDESGRTIISAHDLARTKGKTDKTAKAAAVGEVLAKKIKEAGISKIVFDRGGFKYHGRIKAVAEQLRKGGVEF